MPVPTSDPPATSAAGAGDAADVADAANAKAASLQNPVPGVLAGLRRRLLIMLLVPLAILAFANAWFEYHAADNIAVQQDLRLQRLAPLLASSIVAPPTQPLGPPVLLLAPAIEDFLKDRSTADFGIATLGGRMLIGEVWLSSPTPSTSEPEFRSEVTQGTIYRIVAQRVKTAGGELVVLLADGSDARQSWVQALLLKVLLPNLLLVLAAALAVNWAVQRALKPLLELKEAVEHRSARDLSPLDTSQSPEEVRPLVESLNRLFALMNAQVQSQRRFIADAAHQLRTPLAGLQAQVEAWAQAVNAPLADIYQEKKAVASVNIAQAAISLGADEINRLRNATRRTTQLANQLLALSRADAEASALQPMQQVDLVDLCEQVLGQHLDAASAKGIDLGLDVHSTAQPGAPLITTGHDWLLRELLSNLTDNAIQYTPPGGSVTMRCAWVDLMHSAIVLEVLDDGPGIAAAERERVLERFYRVKGTATEGNGLGLAIADEIARLHGSRLLLDDASQYTARDPIARDTSGRRPRSLTYSASQHHTGLRAALYLRPSCAAALP